MTNYLAENGRRITVIGQISIKGSVKRLGIPSDAWGCGLPFIENIQDPTVTHGWGDEDTSNQKCLVIPGEPYSNAAVAWGSTVPDRPAYMPKNPENAHATAHRVCDDSLCSR